METSLLQLMSISDSWMSPSSIFIPMDVIFGVLCGVGLFFLLIPFLKTYPVSPPPGSEENTAKSCWIKNMGGGGRAGTMGHSFMFIQPDGPLDPLLGLMVLPPVFCSPTKHPLLDPTPHPFWNPTEKPLPLSPLLSYLKFLEDLMQQKFSQIFGGMSSMLSESVVAAAWVSKRPSSARPKTVRFSDSCGTFPALPMAQGPPQDSQAQPLPHQLETPSLAGVTEAQTLDNLPSSTPNQALSSSSRRTHVKAGSTSERGIQATLLTENQPWQQDLEWKDTIGSNVQTRQADISQPTHNFTRDTLPTEAIRSASILSEHYQFLQHHEETQTEDRMTMVTEQQGSPSRLLPSQELTQLQGHFPAHSPSQPEDKPDLPQPDQPSILGSKSSKLSQMMGSVPWRMPLKEGPEKRIMYDSIKEGPSFRAKDLPGTSISSPGKGLEPRNPALRTDQRSYVNTTQDLSFLDPKIQRKLESNITQLSEKRRWEPYLHTLESIDLTPSRAPGSSLPQIIYPSSSTCGSKAEYYSKAAMILEKLHQQDPGGTRLETASGARLESPLFAHPPSEVQEMQRATPPPASHGPFKAHPVKRQRYLSSQTRAFCFQGRTQPSRTVRGTGRGSLHPSSSPRMPKHAPWKRFENVASGRPCWRGTMPGPQEGVKQTNRSEEKEETHPVWKVTLGSTEILNGQTINIHLRDFKSTEANRSPGQLQTPTPQYSGDLALKVQICSKVDFRSSKQPQASPLDHRPDIPSEMSLSSENSLPSFQHRSKILKTSHGLDDVFKRRDQSQETQYFRATKDKSQAKNHKVFHPNDERKRFNRSRATCQGKRSRRGKPCTPSSTQLKNIATTGSESSLYMTGKGQDSLESYLKKIIRHVLQYLNLNIFSRDALENERSPPATVRSQESVTREKLVYSMATEVQSLMNVVVQILVNWLGLKVGDPSEAQWHRLEPLTSQVGGSHHSSEGLYDPKDRRPARRMSSDHTSPKSYSYPFTHKGIRDKHQLVVGAQRACHRHQNRGRRRMGIDQVPTSKGEQPSQSHVATQRACDPHQIIMKSRMGCCPHTSPKGHYCLFRHRDAGDKHRASDRHQSTKKGMGCGHLISPKENSHPVTFRGTGDKEQSSAAQRAAHPKWTLPA
ncbi:4931408C20Rik [Phodopus roborovskii]|uniref:4931408C20Rik protein n=1 Tax=Phodopus roborovskii TaxID=109678 RepID=A0AAU9ZRR9_PHORO|nr:4931408C20Rik [Phodopus roborovskii]